MLARPKKHQKSVARPKNHQKSVARPKNHQKSVSRPKNHQKSVSRPILARPVRAKKCRSSNFWPVLIYAPIKKLWVVLMCVL